MIFNFLRKNESNESKLEKWLNSISSEEKIPNTIKAINIGLFETQEGYSLYLIGSNTYSSTDDDWASNEDFTPKNKYLGFNFDKKLEWREFLDWVHHESKNIIGKNNLFTNIDTITVGFDDGELILVKGTKQ